MKLEKNFIWNSGHIDRHSSVSVRVPLRTWRDGLVVKGPCYSSRGLESVPSTHGRRGTTSSRDSVSSFGLHRPLHIHGIHTDEHIINI